jgi:hypothetical protein
MGFPPGGLSRPLPSSAQKRFKNFVDANGGLQFIRRAKPMDKRRITEVSEVHDARIASFLARLTTSRGCAIWLGWIPSHLQKPL